MKKILIAKKIVILGTCYPGNISCIRATGLFFWSSITDGTMLDVLVLKNWHTTPALGGSNRAYGFPIRCLKD